MTTTDIPTQIGYGQIVGRFVRFTADTPDPGNVPDEIPLEGTITLTPLTTAMRWPTAVPPRLAVADTLTCLVVDGDLYPPGGGPTAGVYVVATDQPQAVPSLVQWRANFNFAGISPQPNPVVFNVPAGGVVDLSIVAPVAPDPPTIVIVDPNSAIEIAQAVEDAEAAAAAAAADAAAAQAAAAASVNKVNKDELVYNVKDHGAVGNGTTDDTAALTAAIAASSGKRIYLPPGTYVTSGLTLGPNRSLVGAGVGLTTLKLKSGSNSTLLTLLDAHDSLLTDMTLDGNKAANTGSGETSVLKIDTAPGNLLSSFHLTVDRLVILNGANNGLTILGKDNPTKVGNAGNWYNWVLQCSNIDIYQCDSYGLFDESSDNRFSNFYLTENSKADIFLQGASGNLYSNFKVAEGGLTHVTSPPTKSDGACMIIESCSMLLMSNIEIQSGFWDGLYAKDCRNLQFNGVDSQNNDNWGYYFANCRGIIGIATVTVSSTLFNATGDFYFDASCSDIDLKTNPPVVGGAPAIRVTNLGAITNIVRQGGGSWPAPQIVAFTSSGTWTKPTGAKLVEVVLQAGGNAGASGRRGAAGTVRCGGGGGGGGGMTRITVDPADLPATVAVTVGSGGTGGTAVTANDTDGNAGGVGTATQFSTYASASVGGAAGGGTAASGTGGTGGAASVAGGAGGTASTTGLVGGGAAGTAGAAGGGGSGGGISSANVAANGGTGATSRTVIGVVGGAAGVVDTTNPTTPTAPTLKGAPGAGGGGGAASITTAAQAGATGAGYGGGGGGGGASLNGDNSGAGGNGAPGYALIITTF